MLNKKNTILFFAIVTLLLLGVYFCYASVSTSCQGIYFNVNLSLGSTGSQVKCLQAILKISETGRFDEATRTALVKYQADKGYYEELGSTGPKTRNSLNLSIGAVNPVKPPVVVTPVKPPPPKVDIPTKEECESLKFQKPLYQGVTDSDVLCLQMFLNKDSSTKVVNTGYGSPGYETIYFGKLTKTAVGKFQIKYDIVKNSSTIGYGIVGPKTRSKINELSSQTTPPPPDQTCENTVSSCGVYPDCAFCSQGQVCENNQCKTTPFVGDCPDGQISYKCMCQNQARIAGSGYCCSNVFQSTQCPACSQGQTQSCSTGYQGICSTGTQTCNSNRTWSSCQQTNQPTAESSEKNNCSDNKDNDCDGLTDAEDTGCSLNHPPVFSNISDKTITAGEQLTFTVSATDQDPNTTLTYSATNLPTGATFNATTKTFTWTPTTNQVGNTNVTFNVSDGKVTVSKTVKVSVTSGVSVNIARGKTYVLNPAPNYSFSTGSSDATDLTDGVYVPAGYNLWGSQLSVGWISSSYVTINMNLGQDTPFSSIKYSTVAHAPNNVYWPDSIFVLGSTDGQNYYLITDMMKDDPNIPAVPTAGNPLPYKIISSGLNAHAKYVKFIIFGGPTHIDEIEIYSGGSNNPYEGNIYPVNEYELLTALKFEKRISSDIAMLNQKAQSIGLDISSDINDINLLMSNIDFKNNISTFKTFVPFEGNASIFNIQKSLFDINGKIMREKGFNGVVVWQNGKWDQLSPFDNPSGTEPEINIKMMNGEQRAYAFNITNASSEIKNINISSSGLGLVEFYKVQAADSTKNNLMSNILVPLSGNAVSVLPGMTQQIWATIKPLAMSPGVNSGTISLSGGVSKTIPSTIDISPNTFSEKLKLSLGMWDYIEVLMAGRSQMYDVNLNNFSAFKNLLRKYKYDSYWAVSWDYGAATIKDSYFDQDNNLTLPSNYFSLFDSWVSEFSGMPMYYIDFSMSASDGGTFAGVSANSDIDKFKARAQSWANTWESHLNSIGLSPDKLSFSIIDEPNSTENQRAFINFAQAVRSRNVNPRIQIWSDISLGRAIYYPIIEVNGQTIFDASDIICAHGSVFTDSGENPNLYLSQQNQGKVLQIYTGALHENKIDPYGFELMQEWLAFKNKAKTINYWAVPDAGGYKNSYPPDMNMYITLRSHYSQLYFDGSNVYSSKHMEAILEGREDYEYLYILETLISQLKNQYPEQSSLISSAEQTLASAVANVTNPMYNTNFYSWDTQKNRTTSETERNRVWQKINEIYSVTGPVAMGGNSSNNSLDYLQNQLASLQQAVMNLLKSLNK